MDICIECKNEAVRLFDARCGWCHLKKSDEKRIVCSICSEYVDLRMGFTAKSDGGVTEYRCHNCKQKAVMNFHDETERIIHQTFGGTKTGNKALEKHRMERANTERSIGWDGKTTKEQRMSKKR